LYLLIDLADINKINRSIDQILVEILQNIDLPSLLLLKLELKIGVLIIVLYNLYLQEGLYNSIYIIVTSLKTYYIEARIIKRDFDN
jgi:hypothetical protein